MTLVAQSFANDAQEVAEFRSRYPWADPLANWLLLAALFVLALMFLFHAWVFVDVLDEKEKAMTKIDVEIFEVERDGFPNEGAVCFIHDGDVYTGWPLIDRDNSYPGNRHFATPEQAKADPLNVQWEASEDCVSGKFEGVTHWFRRPQIKPKKGSP